MAEIPFFKMHGAGNDFILIDNREGHFSGREQAVFARLCSRPLGLGADGLLLIEPGSEVDFVLRYYNADGRPAEMCGNGARCGVWAAHRLGLCGRQARFRVFDRIYQARLEGPARVRLALGRASQVFSPDQLQAVASVHPRLTPLGVWNTGVPHLVLHSQVPLEEINVQALAPRYRYHEQFNPAGVNVNFVVAQRKGVLRVRVYERGVERETLSCGTGAVACALAAHQAWGWPAPIHVVSEGGTLEVSFTGSGGETALTGPVQLVCRGWLNSEVGSPEPGE
ncbi:MAG: diaminopimelate epimerase [Calditrichaeota bacterium]|nr:MAG: diaminopimelate epimerase [Calditrichota bacterium]